MTPILSFAGDMNDAFDGSERVGDGAAGIEGNADHHLVPIQGAGQIVGIEQVFHEYSSRPMLVHPVTQGQVHPGIGRKEEGRLFDNRGAGNHTRLREAILDVTRPLPGIGDAQAGAQPLEGGILLRGVLDPSCTRLLGRAADLRPVDVAILKGGIVADEGDFFAQLHAEGAFPAGGRTVTGERG